MYNILIVYHYDDRYDFPMRATTWDHLYSFKHYSPHRCFYLNLAFRRVPRYFAHIKFDLIIFHTIFLSTRWDLSFFKWLMEEVHELKEMKATKVALPQDEYIHTDILCDFINDYEIDYVFSVSPELEWPKIYHKVNFEKTKFYKILTGYLDDLSIKYINQLSYNSARPIGIGYRARHVAPWLGRHGLLKVKIAEVFQEKAPEKGLITDISTHQKDVLLSSEWYKFLLRCKYTIGVSGGSSILDQDGTLKVKTEEYLKLHPQSSFEEVEQACFPQKDGSLNLSVITPRNLEACATRTCQILVEGDYNGILEPGKHYIELKRDFSNLDQVLDLVKQDSLREKITSNAYKDIVESGRYTYREMVRFILENSLSTQKAIHQFSARKGLGDDFFYFYTRSIDKLDWIRVAFLWRKYLWNQWISHLIHTALPMPVISLIRRVRQILRRDQ